MIGARKTGGKSYQMKALRLIRSIALTLVLAGSGMALGIMWFSTLPSLVVLGDSVSAGEYLPSRLDAYPHLLAVDLRTRLIVYAVPGHTTEQTYDMYHGDLDSTYVVIELGTNDYNDSVPLPTFAAEYRGVVASIAPATQMICLSIWDPRSAVDTSWSSSPQVPAPVNRVGASPAEYNAIIEQTCRGLYLSIQSLYDTPAYHGSGTLGYRYHPDAAGDAAIAQLVYARLNTSLTSA